MPISSNGSTLKVLTNYNGSVEPHQESRQIDYLRNQQTEPISSGQRRKVVVVDKEKGTKVTYDSNDEALLEAAERDAANRNMKQPKARKPRAKKTTKPKTDKE